MDCTCMEGCTTTAEAFQAWSLDILDAFLWSCLFAGGDFRFLEPSRQAAGDLFPHFQRVIDPAQFWQGQCHQWVIEKTWHRFDGDRFDGAVEWVSSATGTFKRHSRKMAGGQGKNGVFSFRHRLFHLISGKKSFANHIVLPCFTNFLKRLPQKMLLGCPWKWSWLVSELVYKPIWRTYSLLISALGHPFTKYRQDIPVGKGLHFELFI